MTIAEKLAYAAEYDLALPYSLICDAWDKMGESDICRESFETLLNEAFEAYYANQTNYVFNSKATW